MAGVMDLNGVLLESYEYDAYGKVRMWDYRPMDYNRDGDQDMDDYNIWLPEYATLVPPSQLQSDPSKDRLVNNDDYWYMAYYFASSGSPPVEIARSMVGNPYFFTGRRLHLVQQDVGAAVNRQIQNNRARHYDPENGRWLEKDPLETMVSAAMSFERSPRPVVQSTIDVSEQYRNGANLYQYTGSIPSDRTDPTGTETVCGPWIASSQALWEFSPPKFIMAKKKIELPTFESGWIGLACAIAVAIKDPEIVDAVPIDQIGVQSSLPEWKFDGVPCYCRFLMRQSCKRCEQKTIYLPGSNVISSSQWRYRQFHCRRAYTQAKLKWRGKGYGYSYDCLCGGPSTDQEGGLPPGVFAEPNKGRWCCPDVPNARCTCTPKPGGRCAGQCDK